MRRTKLSVSIEVHEKIISLLNEGVPIKRVASRLGVGVRTVQRRAYAEREAESDDAILFKKTNWRCPRHGLLNVKPCVLCEAEKNRSN